MPDEKDYMRIKTENSQKKQQKKTPGVQGDVKVQIGPKK